MDNNTMQLAVITDTSHGEPESGEPMHQRWHLFTARPPKKHRIQDLVARLRRDLRASQDLNEEMGGMLKDALERNVDLQEQVTELTERLRVAEEANVMNAHALSFAFTPRPIDGHEDQATMPVPQVELFSDDDDVKSLIADASTAFLNRVMPKTHVEGEWITATAEAAEELKLVPAFTPPVAPIHGNATMDPWALIDDEDDESDDDEDDGSEIYDATSSGWSARPHVVAPPVTWGQSTTGTFRVTALQQRGTGPTAVPGLTD